MNQGVCLLDEALSLARQELAALEDGAYDKAVSFAERRNEVTSMTSRAEAQALLERVGYLADSLPEDLHDAGLSPEIQEYAKTLALTRLRLTAVLAQYDSALAPALALIKRLEKMQDEISGQLPVLWKNYYLQGPVPWLSPVAWANFSRQMHYSIQGMPQRVPCPSHNS